MAVLRCKEGEHMARFSFKTPPRSSGAAHQYHRSSLEMDMNFDIIYQIRYEMWYVFAAPAFSSGGGRRKPRARPLQA